MDPETVKAKMRKQVEDARKIAGPMQWGIDENEFNIFVEMRHRRKTDHVFLLRVSFDDYPQRAPSYVFVDRDKRQPGGWPPNVKHGGEPPGICTPGTRECIEHYHVKDAQYEWNPEKYPLRLVLLEIQKLIERGISV